MSEFVTAGQKENKDEQFETSVFELPTWYSKAEEYWNGQEASMNGVLGGFGFVSKEDIRDSERFLKRCWYDKVIASSYGRLNTNHFTALDCGAGIGRVTENLLLRYFHEVDVEEPVGHFLKKAQHRIEEKKKKLRMKEESREWKTTFFQQPAQTFCPILGRYDVIWLQWMTGQLKDDDLIAFLGRCASGLRPNGKIFLKENVSIEHVIYDDEDSSVTRSLENFEIIFRRANLQLVSKQIQTDFPEWLLDVYMFCLVPGIL